MSEIIKGLNDAINKQTWLDQLAEPVQQIVAGFYARTGKVGQKIADFLNGVWLGHPLHPVITDVPVGAWTAAMVLDSMAEARDSRALERGADAAVTLGVVSAAGAAVTGLTDWQHTVGESRRTGILHATINTIALGLYVGSLVTRSQRNRSLGRDLALAGYLFAAAGAFLGGDMVYRQKIGVNHAPEPDEIKAPKFIAVLDEQELPENKLTRAQLKNLSLVLLRRGDTVYALAETCAHLGGPLAKGKLGEDDQGAPTVVCPWHGSRYNMDNGNILNGPSAYPQPCFEARINNGKVEVRYRQTTE